jgi:hypothetical protein
MNKKKILKTLADYFAKKGTMMSPAEYKAAEDAPIRFMVAKRSIGSWARILQMVRMNFPEQYAKAMAGAAPAVPATPKPKVASKAKVAPKKAKKVGS